MMLLRYLMTLFSHSLLCSTCDSPRPATLQLLPVRMRHNEVSFMTRYSYSFLTRAWSKIPGTCRGPAYYGKPNVRALLLAPNRAVT
ncbi:uncharacterized protein HD556DRAFT_1356414 [Suillus plorans]|uniref:Secreted protein n=1 Tax=Suillus plorans TaxID=116603 RepID=A0A9P7IXZ4_9AGAM|nr:uncharacterized protein HD556DRAFT_1356414 [Suillus plorans]KAG1797403.1 hypothetical protein HD556DRAFT_1356414 [Suillus plorans]